MKTKHDIQKVAINLDTIKKDLTYMLSLLNPKDPFGKELYNAIARVTISVAVEIVPWRVNLKTGKLEILLIRRQPDDSHGGLLHTPGTIMLVGEEVERDTISRLINKELGQKCRLSDIIFVGNINYPNEVRGHCLSPVYTARVNGKQEEGEWWPIEELPPIEDCVKDHLLRLWPMAIQAILQHTKAPY